MNKLKLKLKDKWATLRALSRLMALGFYVALVVCMGLFIQVLPAQKRERLNMELIQFWSRLCCSVFGLRVRSEGEAVPHQMGVLVVANHMSYFDIVCLGCVIPGIFIAKTEVSRWPLIGFGARMVGTLFVDRSNKASRSKLKDLSVDRIKKKQNVFIFPEGTTSDGRKLLPFRYGAFDIAMQAKCPVLPVAINYTSPEIIQWTGNAPFFSHILKIARKNSIDVRVHVGKLLGYQSYNSTKEFAEAAWDEVNSMLVHFGMRAAAQLATVDWETFKLPRDASEEQIADFMQRVLSLMLQVDSSTAPGERQVCHIVQSVLRVNGLEAEELPSPNGHMNLLATKGVLADESGDMDRGYVVLMGNMDVIPTSNNGWDHPPFSGALAEGFVWGRGAIDMKGLLAVYLTCFIMADDSIPVKMLFVADQERGGREGSRFVAEHHMEAVKPRIVLGEGGFGISDLFGSETPVFLMNTAEKGSLWIKLAVELKTSAHSAIPPEEYPLSIITKAAQRATFLDSDFMFLPVTERFLSEIRQKNAVFNKISNQAMQVPFIRGAMRRPFDEMPFFRAMFRNTLAVTDVSHTGAKNALAQRVKARLDCRLLPGTSPDEVMTRIEKLIDDKRVQMEKVHYSPANETSFDDDGVVKLREAIEEVAGDGVIPAPILFPAHTALGAFRDKGVPCVGIFPGLFKQGALNLIHGPNERVSVKQLTLARQIISQFVAKYRL